MKSKTKILGPAGTAKSYGLESLNELSERIGKSLSCLHVWYRVKPELFHSVCLGTAIRKAGQAEKFDDWQNVD